LANDFLYLDDLLVSLPDDEEQRRAYRTAFPGLVARVGPDTAWPVKDVSATGVSVQAPSGALSPGDVFQMDLVAKDKVVVTDLTARVRRLGESGAAGCEFEGLDRHQEERLDKFVLEVQKRLISMRHKREEE
jgi:hypothetical protein